MRENLLILSRAGEHLVSGFGCLSEGIVVTRPDSVGGGYNLLIISILRLITHGVSAAPCESVHSVRTESRIAKFKE